MHPHKRRVGGGPVPRCCQQRVLEIWPLEAQATGLPCRHERQGLETPFAPFFRQKATTLAAGLAQADQRDAERKALRGFVEKIVIPPGAGLMQVAGNLGGDGGGGRGENTRPSGRR